MNSYRLMIMIMFTWTHERSLHIYLFHLLKRQRIFDLQIFIVPVNMPL